jgi:hypothetical protein
MMITLKLKSGTFWGATSCCLVDGYQCLQKTAASVFGVQEANLDLEDEVGSSKNCDDYVSNPQPSHLQTLPSIADLRSSNRVFKDSSVPKAYISNK